MSRHFHWLSVALLIPLLGANWHQFRGNSSGGAAADQDLPLRWDVATMENVTWQADLPGRGVSGPVVIGDRVVVTCSSNHNQDRLHVLCFDAVTGKPLWHRQFWATGRTMCHPTSANAAPTPASDGNSVFAFFSSNDLICLDLDGNLKWFRGLAHDFPHAGNDVGMASSPVVADGTVVVQIENQGDSFMAALDTSTGLSRWRVDREREANWSSPIILRRPDGRSQVLVKSSAGLDAYDLLTGKRQWSYPVPSRSIPSLTITDNDVFLPADGMLRLSVPSANEDPELKWSSSTLRPGSASPLVHDGHLYALSSAGVLVCGDIESGDIVWRLRLKGPFWASPVLAGDHLYCINDAGQAQIVKLGTTGELVATNDFGQTVQGSPAIANHAMFVRSTNSLWKIAHP